MFNPVSTHDSQFAKYAGWSNKQAQLFSSCLLASYVELTKAGGLPSAGKKEGVFSTK